MSSFAYETFAEYQDGKQLPAAYIENLTTNLSGDSVSLVLKPLTNREATESHAVYVKVRDQVDSKATSWFCFMVTNGVDDFC